MGIGRYNRIVKNIDSFFYSIRTFIPSPTESDYKRGYITRYFVQKANDPNSYIYEVSKDFYKTILTNSLLSKTSLDWRIKGEISEVKKSNSESIRYASKKIPKLSMYLPNLIQFRKK